jgi:hypothetical protein
MPTITGQAAGSLAAITGDAGGASEVVGQGLGTVGVSGAAAGILPVYGAATVVLAAIVGLATGAGAPSLARALLSEIALFQLKVRTRPPTATLAEHLMDQAALRVRAPRAVLSEVSDFDVDLDIEA